MSHTVKQVKGYLTSDNTFFETASQAELYEAENELRDAAERNDISADKLIDAINAVKTELERYLNAVNAQVKAEKSEVQARPSNASANPAIDAGTETPTAPVQQQSPRRR